MTGTNGHLTLFMTVLLRFALSVKSFHLLHTFTIRRFRTAMSASSTELEIEQKFAVDDGQAIEARLRELGMENKSQKVIVDWYYDVENEPLLTPKDQWLRYRQTDNQAVWQLKRGRSHEGGTTLYEEIEGREAVEVAAALLPDSLVNKSSTCSEFEGLAVPKLPVECSLAPFARIESTRSSWSYPAEQGSTISVDLDRTSHGYSVGEVETVVQDESEIAEARQAVQGFLAKLLPTTDAIPPVGKLEHYLMRNRPDHYAACVSGGSIKKRDP